MAAGPGTRPGLRSAPRLRPSIGMRCATCQTGLSTIIVTSQAAVHDDDISLVRHMSGSHHSETGISDSGVPVRRLRVGVVGLSHYHVTGWVETLETLDDLVEIVALYDPDPERGRTLGPPHHDPTLRAALGERYRDLPFETRLDELIARHALDLALVTLPNADAPGAIAQLAAAGIHLLIDKPTGRIA